MCYIYRGGGGSGGTSILCTVSCRGQEERDRQAQLRGPPKIDPDVAATAIQKVGV